MEGTLKSKRVDLNWYIEKKKQNQEFLTEQKEESKPEPKKSGWAIGQQLQQNKRAKSNLTKLIGSTNKVFSYIQSSSLARSNNQEVLDQGLQNIDPHTASQLLIAQRKFRGSHTLSHEIFSFAKNPEAFDSLKKIKEAPTNKGVVAELNYIVRNFDCVEPFEELLKCVLNYQAQEFCLAENKRFVHCIQEPATDLVLMSWGI